MSGLLNIKILLSLMILLLAGFFILKESSLVDTLLTPKVEVPTRDVYLGFWTQGLWDDNTKTLHPEKLEELEKKVGKKAAIAHYFRGWQALESPESAKDLNLLISKGYRPMISVNPYFFEKDCEARGATLYKAISIGNCDEVMRKIARNLKNVYGPFFFRFAWEMNVSTMDWSMQKTASWDNEFIASWIRFHNIMAEEGVTNAIWVFSPQIETPSTFDFAKLYPGDAYVDWVGLDGYNWGTTQSWSDWQDFSSVFRASYDKMQLIAPGKPIMIAEVNTTDVGGDKAAWYKDMLTHQIPDQFPDLNAVIFFNEDKSKSENVNWRIDSSPDALEEFKQGIANPIYKSSF